MVTCASRNREFSPVETPDIIPLFLPARTPTQLVLPPLPPLLLLATEPVAKDKFCTLPLEIAKNPVCVGGIVGGNV